ncbi:MAG: 1-acyl-sn-glycerol-3-phosphate acyltransferase [Acidobacteriota bacterium]|nr:1-acyl-sn-glycerol-3-phosphate acyltransferase [Acidobacteriota bacterium]
MNRTVTLPLWLVVILGVFALWALLDRLLIPSIRWYFRRRINRVIDHFNRRLAIRLQPFKLTKRQVLLDRLTYDPEVLEAVEAFAQEHEMPRAVVMNKVQRYAHEIVPAFNAYVYFRVGYLIARTVARLLYRVRLGSADERALATVDPEATVVFLMNHRSNMDYVLVSYMVADRSALSYAVGEWARIWPLETLIRSMGAYFVRRKSRNALYRKVLQRYVQMATANGVTQAVYPEGGLSRDGALRPPKLGLLDYMLRDFDPDGERDLVFIPVGLNYDRTLEDRTLLRDLDPGAERKDLKSTLGTTVRFVGKQLRLMVARRWHRFGYACVNFGAPISTRAELERLGVDLRELSRDERFARVSELAERWMAAVGDVVPVLPVSLTATVFARSPEQALSLLELKSRVQELIQQLQGQGAAVYVPRRDGDYAINVGLRMLTLRRLVEEEDGLYRPVPEELPVLTYYANSIRHLLPSATADELPAA